MDKNKSKPFEVKEWLNNFYIVNGCGECLAMCEDSKTAEQIVEALVLLINNRPSSAEWKLNEAISFVRKAAFKLNYQPGGNLDSMLYDIKTRSVCGEFAALAPQPEACPECGGVGAIRGGSTEGIGEIPCPKCSSQPKATRRGKEKNLKP